MAQSKITGEHKYFIVQALACYDTPSAVAEAVNEKFGVLISRQAIECYDPTKHAGRALGTKWRVIFDVTRKAFRESLDSIPIAHKAVRLRELEDNYRRMKRMKNYVGANAVLEQAAKEVGDVFTNRQKIEANVKATARTVIVPAKA